MHDGGPFTYTNISLKFVCSIILHLMMQPLIIEPIKRLYYVLNHKEDFEQLFIPMMLCVLKIIAELGIEWTLIVSTAYENDSYYLVMDFTALMVI